LRKNHVSACRRVCAEGEARVEDEAISVRATI
jgi:hypothetical protein